MTSHDIDNTRQRFSDAVARGLDSTDIFSNRLAWAVGAWAEIDEAGDAISESEIRAWTAAVIELDALLAAEMEAL